MATEIQRQYGRYQQPGYPGEIARPTEPCIKDIGTIEVPTNGAKPRPGEGVVYDGNANGFKIPTSDAEEGQIVAIVSYDRAELQKKLAATPTGANSDQFIEYDDGETAKLIMVGTVWGIAREGMEFGDSLQFDRDSRKWETFTPTAAHIRTPIKCVSRKPVAADGLVEIRIGTGGI